jgi:diadenosine tetraphosphate (Ap4A) HIT family hydrolase
MTSSPFHNRARWVAENELAFVIRDIFPVSPGHTLIIPKRVVPSIFELREDEIAACWALLTQQRKYLTSILRPIPDAFNVGVNDGSIAGQTIAHAHIHLIPRYAGDHPDPRGGIRAVIPGKSIYDPCDQ